MLHFVCSLGCLDPHTGADLRDMIQTDNFRVVVVDDVTTVEVCGALKVSFILFKNYTNMLHDINNVPAIMYLFILFLTFVHIKNVNNTT